MAVMNWKCNPRSVSEADALAEVSDVEGVIVCPPSVFLGKVAGKLKNASLGAQNGFREEGAYTGENSFGQLKSVGAKYVILGHSERRNMFGETSAVVSEKVKAALSAGLVPILCVGEKKRSGTRSAVKTVIGQLSDSIVGIPAQKVGKIVIAYEPVWAISAGGIGRNASLGEVLPVMVGIKNWISEKFGKKIKVLYGGTVLPENVAEYLSDPRVSGVLVGGASIDKNKASKVIKNAFK